ncbi:MAG: hypothetical protein ABFD46_05715 [Armatimonadota bacterium]
MSVIRNYILLVLALAALALPVEGASPRPKVVLVIADYITLSDLLDSKLPGIHKLTSEGAIGLICPGTTGAGSVQSCYASVSAGSYCWAGNDVDQAYSSFELLEDEDEQGPAGVVFQRRTGLHSMPAVVQLEVPLLDSVNLEKRTNSLPGALGDILYKDGKKAAVFGNSDLADKKRRRAAIIAANGVGSVATGDISFRVLRRDPLSPTGFVTDSAKLASAVDGALESVDFVVADFGDTARVELNKTNLSDYAYSKQRAKALRNLDSFLTRILKAETGQETIILASMAAKVPERGEKSRLAPIVIFRPGSPGGSLISATTRTPGLVSGFDIAPTVLASLDLAKPSRMVGTPITMVSGRESRIRWLDNLVLLCREAVWPVLGVLAAIGIAAITAAGAVIALGKAVSERVGAVLKVLLVATMSSPLAMFFAVPGSPSVVPYALRLSAWVIALTAAAFGMSGLLKRALGDRINRLPGALPIVTLALITTIVLFIEACRGGQLIRFALPSVADFRGYRFYGVGNEYMGVWLGCALVAIVWLRECFPGWRSSSRGKSITIAASVAVVLGLGIPAFGANAGGAIAAIVGLGTVYISGLKDRFGARDIVMLVVLGGLVVTFIGLMDTLLSRGGQSHIGLAASVGSRGGYMLLCSTIVRKLSMNVSLIGTPQSQMAMIGAIPFFFLWFSSIGKKIDKLYAGRPAFRSGIAATIVGAGAAFLFNDSGIVAGGLIFGFLVLAVLYSLLDSLEPACP